LVVFTTLPGFDLSNWSQNGRLRRTWAAVSGQRSSVPHEWLKGPRDKTRYVEGGRAGELGHRSADERKIAGSGEVDEKGLRAAVTLFRALHPGL